MAADDSASTSRTSTTSAADQTSGTVESNGCMVSFLIFLAGSISLISTGIYLMAERF